jgi:hypothetical protein
VREKLTLTTDDRDELLRSFDGYAPVADACSRPEREEARDCEDTAALAQADWQARLETLNREHREALAELRLSHSEQLAAIQKAHDDSGRASEERWARMQKVHEQSRLHYESRLATLESRLTEEKVRAVALVRAEYEEKLEMLRAANAQLRSALLHPDVERARVASDPLDAIVASVLGPQRSSRIR